MRRRICCTAHVEPMGPGAVAGWFERRRVGCDCAGMSAAGLGSDSGGSVRCAGAFHRDLLAEADAGAHSGARASAAVRGAVFDSGCDWADGADNSDVQLLFRTLSGQDSLDPVSPPVALREPGVEELRANRNWVFRGRWAGSSDGGDAGGGCNRAAAALPGRGLSRGALQAEYAGAAAQAVGEVLCAVRGKCFMRPEIRGHEGQLSPIFQRVSRVRRGCTAADRHRICWTRGGLDLLRAKTLDRDARVSSAAVPGGERAGVQARRSVAGMSRAGS